MDGKRRGRYPGLTVRARSASSYNTDDLIQQRCGSRVELCTRQIADWVWGKDDGILGRAPQTGHSSRCGHKNVGTNGDGRKARLLKVDAVVHTARAARPSTTNGHNGIVAGLR